MAVRVFRNIPYAAAPTGAARFAAPVPVDGVPGADGPGPTAPAPDRSFALDLGPVVGPGWVRGEDYLTLNVWTPRTDGGTPRADRGAPVMVFVHGGGFVSGTGQAPLFDGTSFARDGVVLVTLNYRLGAPGWLDLPDVPRNRGLLDVIAALRWVRTHIAEYGGDPGRVTVFGQSAGAMIVSALLVTSEAAGLFHRAISQSGGLHTLTGEEATETTRALADRLGVPPTAGAFAAVPDERLVSALAGVPGRGSRLSPLGVVMDEAGPALPADVLVGTNTEESRLYQRPEHTAAIDAMFRDARNRLVARYEGAFSYDFDWRGGPLGACHTVELPFVFDNTELPALRTADGLLGPDVPAALAAEMHGAWVRFAATGDPGWSGHRTFR
ncbi:carboxylesterase/lipase family protein [Streptomyces sp. NEAU-Y11]|uniref:carboxylesterase/lipase family protein n=1 Tax=Streptomyces cucumeris TaxID=2962890 RepID=UPI0020C93461|nr:carboxylesterase family protein [Streptomyces sp. NEAU-Y11]MCP9212270.1 carboxylesterase family protein [Streptomyces sp. NEAU-Y11]